MSIDDARRVAADMLRQAGDETGARVLGCIRSLHDAVRRAATGPEPSRRAWHLLAYLDAAWAAAEVERAHGEALEMQPHGWLREHHGDWPVRDESDPRGEWDPEGMQE